MGVNISLILPNDCYDISDNALAVNVLKKTVQRITDYFNGQENFISDIVINGKETDRFYEYYYISSKDDIGSEEYSFSIPIINATCYLRQGYWDIWMNARYFHYFYPTGLDINGNLNIWARDDAFNIARMFGFSEGWICDEYHSWNSILDEEPYNSSFEKWKIYGENDEDKKIYEFSLDVFNGEIDRYLDYNSKYHDSFSECYKKIETLEKKYPDYKILIIGRPSHMFALASKNNSLFIINIETGESLTSFPIDSCEATFNRAGFTISKDNNKAFFTTDGVQLTEFRKGNFSWSWDNRYGGDFDIAITDEATNEVYIIFD